MGVPAGRSVVFFDGVCALCNRLTRWLIRADRRRALCYAPLQGPTFAALAPELKPDQGLDSIVYVRACGTAQARTFVRSDAILQILRDVGGVWGVLSWLRVVPRPLRDLAYDWVARHRYRWFGRYDSCRLPAPPESELLLP